MRQVRAQAAGEAVVGTDPLPPFHPSCTRTASPPDPIAKPAVKTKRAATKREDGPPESRGKDARDSRAALPTTLRGETWRQREQ